jgi:hypothetical protein
MVQTEVVKVAGRTPKYELTISSTGVAYLPALVYQKYFAPHVWVRLTFDRSRREVSIIPSDKRHPNSIAITMPTRGYQIRMGELLRQMEVKPGFKIKSLTERDGRIIFLVPKEYIET